MLVVLPEPRGPQKCLSRRSLCSACLTGSELAGVGGSRSCPQAGGDRPSSQLPPGRGASCRPRGPAWGPSIPGRAGLLPRAQG